MPFRIIKLKQIENFLKAAPQVAAKKSFLFSTLFILLALIIGGMIFYWYDVLPGKKEPKADQVSLKLKTESYLSVLAQWQAREEKFEAADFKNWPDPFSSSGLTK